LTDVAVPPLCVLEFDGDLSDHVAAEGITSPWSSWACFHTSMRVATIDALLIGSAQLTAQTDPALTLDKKVLPLPAARKIVAAAEAEATKRGLAVVIVVVDDSGTMIELTRMDAAQVASLNVGIGKARTAAIYVARAACSRNRYETVVWQRWHWPTPRRFKVAYLC
jgi:hypothetical protein